MKLLLVTLALTAFPGSQAFVPRDESNSKLEQLLNGVYDYTVSTVFGEFIKIGEIVHNSDIGNAVNSWFDEIQKKAYQKFRALGDALPPEVKQVESQVSSAFTDLERKLSKDLAAIRKIVDPEVEDFYRTLEFNVNPILEKLEPYVEPSIDSLAKTGIALTEKLNEMVKWQLEKLQPVAKELPIHFKEVQDSLEPIADQVQKYVIVELEKANSVLQQSAARVLEEFQKYKEGFDQWVRAPPFPEDH